MEHKGILSALSLKVIMAVFMLMDHLRYFLPEFFPVWFHYVGRIVAPTFCYLMTVSLFHTRDRRRYIRRMAAAGLLMLAGSIALMIAVDGPFIGNTIFISLAIGAALVDRVERLKLDASGQAGSRAGHIAAAALLFAASLFAEGAFLVPVLALIFYFLRDNRPAMYLAFLLLGSAMLWMFRTEPAQYLQALAIIPISLYNGKKGGNSAFSKWFFYIFYPAHVWGLYICRHVIFIR